MPCVSSLDFSLACFCEQFGESLASVNQLRKTGGRNTRRHITDRLMRVLAFRALGSVGQCPLLQEKERAKETEREKERDRDREGSCHSTDLSAQQSPIMGQSFLTSVQHDGVLLQH